MDLECRHRQGLLPPHPSIATAGAPPGGFGRAVRCSCWGGKGKNLQVSKQGRGSREEPRENDAGEKRKGK